MYCGVKVFISILPKANVYIASLGLPFLPLPFSLPPFFSATSLLLPSLPPFPPTLLSFSLSSSSSSLSPHSLPPLLPPSFPPLDSAHCQGYGFAEVEQLYGLETIRNAADQLKKLYGGKGKMKLKLFISVKGIKLFDYFSMV